MSKHRRRRFLTGPKDRGKIFFVRSLTVLPPYKDGIFRSAFVRLRQMLASHKDFERRLDALEERYDEQFKIVSDAIRSLWVYDATGVEIPQDVIRFDVYENPRGGLSAQGRIGYRCPMQKRGDLPRIKLDLTTDEVFVLDPVVREVPHPYSDRPEQGIQINSYGDYVEQLTYLLKAPCITGLSKVF